MNGVTGRMGYHQHLLRSVLVINADGGVPLSDGRRIRLEPVLVGRSADKRGDIAARHRIADWTTSLDEALAEVKDGGIYFDAQVAGTRYPAVMKAIAAGAHVYVEKPSGATSQQAAGLAEAARQAGVRHGVVAGVRVPELGMRSLAEGRRVEVPRAGVPEAEVPA